MDTKRTSSQDGRVFARCIAALRAFYIMMTSSYRPERHYMRGGRTGGVA
jgi:hypothetical protein